MIEHTIDPLIFNTAVNKAKYKEKKVSDEICPFCDVENLQNILKTDGDKIWLKNKFSTIEASLMTVLIESAEHLGDISTYSLKENRELFKFAFDCWFEMLDSKEYESTLMFKNFGPMSGGTLRHPHLQIVGLKDTNSYEYISPENFIGLEVIKTDNVEVNISEKPIMGFCEINVIISEREQAGNLADKIHQITEYLLTDYMDGRCKSYNLFFYQLDNKLICKVVPRFITSPYFIGYKIPQVNNAKQLELVRSELLEKL